MTKTLPDTATSTDSSSTETALRAAKRPRTILAGPYGHPFHALMVTIPIGAWVASLVFDIAGGITGDWETFATGAQWLIGIGILGALAAAVLGFLDFTKLTPQTKARRIATVHMVLNLFAVVLFAINFFVRAADPGEASVGGIVLSVVGLLGLAISGTLGGELTYRYGVRVADEETQRKGYQP